MKKFGKGYVVLRVLLGIGQLGFAQSPVAGVPQTTWAASGSDVSAKLTLLVYNDALSRAELQRSEGEATAIFKHAGLELEWVNCSLSPAEVKSFPACQVPIGLVDFVLRILTADMAKQWPSHHEALGFALPCPRNQAGCFAYILYSNVLEVAGYGVADGCQVLGHAMAHEIGHLLLGSDSHVSIGIMRAHWGRRDLRTIATGHLLFTQQQSDRIRNEVLERRTARPEDFGFKGKGQEDLALKAQREEEKP